MSKSLSIRFRNLTVKAGTFTEVIGREAELRRLVQILLRPTHHHAAIIGEPGVGKSSLIEMLTLGISEGAIPQLPSKVYLLDTAPILSLFIAGDSLHACFDALRAQMAQLQEAIIIVEDIQLLAVDDPSRLELTLELLQAITSQTGVRLIVTTTETAFRRTFHDDYIFNRTFVPLEVTEPDMDTIAVILENAAMGQATDITPEAAALIVNLSKRYGHGRALPDAALRLFEEVVVKISFDGRKKIEASDVRDVISDREKVPLASLDAKGVAHLAGLEERLYQVIVGQRSVTKTIARTITNSQLGLGDDSRPRGSFLLLGPSGVGKTETAKVLTELVYANSKALIRLDMSEYSEPHSAVRLTGSPPGYVGYEEGGQLTGAVNRQPYSLVLLDEIEKAHPKLFDVFLQLLDDGRLTDSSGKTADFTQTLLLATSNIGSQEITSAYMDGIDVNSPAFLRSVLMPLLLNHFRPEFINRFDAILVYQPLSEPQLVALAQRELSKLGARLSPLGISFNVPNHYLADLLHQDYNPLLGARPVKRLITTHFELPLGEQITSGRLHTPTIIVGGESWLSAEPDYS
jgi:ATP-dependent Clp protease ATP-binding subunit ClpC